jgi:sulfhydrogenase subunit gamma (sulfur reductase)
MARKMNCTKDPYLPEPATIVGKRQLTATEAIFDIRLDSARALGSMPGQFVEISVAGVGEAPISISSAGNGGDCFQVVARRVGRVTSAMHRRQAGDKLGIRGPFGTHYPVDGAMLGRDVVFIAGGIGFAPLRSAIQYVLKARKDYGEVTILYGVKSPPERLFVDELEQWGKRSDVTLMETVDRADEQWRGNVGVITTLIPKARINPDKAVIVACGPPIMYKFILVSLFGIGVSEENIFMSLERRMKCGIGKCGHCQINGLYACLDGPVFNYEKIVDVQEAI